MTQLNKQNISYQTIAESLLGRALTAQDGIEQSVLDQTEQRLEQALPTELKNLYQTVGKVPQFMSAFQLFALPEQLHIKDGLLVFLEENQGVCYWGVDQQGKVFQCDEDGSSYNLEFDLQSFLELMLYYQVAQGAEFSYCSNLLDQELAELYKEDGWQQVGNYDDLVIYQLKNYLIWYFKDEDNNVLEDMVYFVSLVEIPEQIIVKYVLEEI
ncbi:hypothetical protein MTZ49_04460 [Entomomonas sp. E2T0]|uniref:hypothetical protein n=1 Tax=Entomomonas sp. E2T0 TaxID=2930213 RepID=UPI00222846D9|nr:hypothetical protein [Entomomonas sp. E2T0]UYZ84825.1 hypothetical protein MTZ49_04460 [Entomomonas sp. E2T0]